VPGASLQVGEERVAKRGSQLSPERRAFRREREGVGLAEHLVRHRTHSQSGAICESSLDTRCQVEPLTADVAVAKAELRRTPVTKTNIEHRRDLVDRLDEYADTIGVVWHGAHRRVGEEGLQPQDALRLRALPFRAHLSDVEEQEAIDCLLRRGRMKQPHSAR
jgi:hypothetical protein